MVGGYVIDLDLHDRADVGTVAGQCGRRAAGVPVVAVASVVVIARVARGESRRGVIVQDQRLAGVLREVDDDVVPFRRGSQQRVLVDVAGVEHGRVIDPRGRVGGDDDRCRQEAALIGDLDPVRTFGTHDRGGEDGCVCQGRRHFVRVQEDLSAGHARALRRRVGVVGITENAVGINRLVQRQVEEAVVGRVEDAEAVGLRVDRECRVSRAVDHRACR